MVENYQQLWIEKALKLGRHLLDIKWSKSYWPTS